MESLIAGLQPKSAHAENHAQVNQKNMRTIKACFHHYGNKKEAQTIQSEKIDMKKVKQISMYLKVITEEVLTLVVLILFNVSSI